MDEFDGSLATAVAVRRSVMALARRLKVERPAGGRTSLELSVLGYLHRLGPLTPGELAAAERVQPQTLTRTLTSLAESGLVSRQEHPHDGRRALLALTEAGRDALRLDMAQRDTWLDRAIRETLTGTECGLLRLAGELLDRLADAGESPASP